MGIDELTSGGGGVSNPLSEDLDAGGNAINNAGAVGTDELYSVPIAVELTKSSDQTLSDDTWTELSWENSTEKNSAAPSLADLSNDGVTVPTSDFDYARVVFKVRFASETTIKGMKTLKNDTAFANGAGQFFGSLSAQQFTIVSGWEAVAQGDTITVEVRHNDGGNLDLTAAATEFEVELR